MKKIKIERINTESGATEVEAVALDVTTRSSPIHDARLLKNNNLDQDNKHGLPQESDSSKKDIDDTLSASALESLDNKGQEQNRDQTMLDPGLATQKSPQQKSTLPQSFPNIHRPIPPGAPANYCNICNKELCNKYFMKTHMQKMHGINLDDYPREAANSGGVVCDICQKELCSKYFLKVHKSNTHGITEFNSGSAGSQAANAATAVAAIALTNYSLNNAQKRAALNLALNQHQLQSRQAAALMNAAAASAAFSPLQMAQAAKAVAIHQRDQMGASTLMGQLQQQQTTSQNPFQVHNQQNQQHQPQQLDLHKQPPTNNLHQSANHPVGMQAGSFPAALLAATASNPLLAAQLAHHHQQQLFPTISSQQTGQQHQTPSLFLNQSSEEPIDTEEDTSDRDSLTDQTNSNLLHKDRIAMNNFHQHLQSQQALLNAAAVFNPAAAAAAVMAMQQQQQQHLHQQQQQQRQQEQSTTNNRQTAAMDLRNQSISQLIARQMFDARQRELDQHQQQLQLADNCNNLTNNPNNAHPQNVSLCREDRDTRRLQDRSRILGPQQRSMPEDEQDGAGEDEQEEGFDSDRDSLVDEGILRQAATNMTLAVAAAAAASSSNAAAAAAAHQLASTAAAASAAEEGNKSTTSNNDGSLSCSLIGNDDDEIINCVTDLKQRNRLVFAQTGCKGNKKTSLSSAASSAHAAGTTTITTAINLNTSDSNSQINNKQFRAMAKHQNFSKNNNISKTPADLSAHISNLLTSTNPSPLATASNLRIPQQISPTNLQQSMNNCGNNNSGGNSGNNNRYLRHYTEACPICDRRFKSIKWLQSHVMNDHKNEIGNQLFNLVVQILLCSNANNNSNNGHGSTNNDAGIDRCTNDSMNGNQPGGADMSVGAEDIGAVSDRGDTTGAGDMSMASLNGLLAGLVGSVGSDLTAQSASQQQNSMAAVAATSANPSGPTTDRGDV